MRAAEGSEHVMLGLDPSISESSWLVLRFSGLRFASPENDATPYAVAPSRISL